MNKLLVSLAVLCIITCNAGAQNKVVRPYQFQINGSGLFLKTFGNILADSEVDKLDVNDWLTPGFSVGYHFNKKYFLSYSFQPNRNLILTEKWTFSDGPNDGSIEVDHNTGKFHTLEFRWAPFVNGFYTSLFATHITKAKYLMEFTRLDSTMHLGTRDYGSDVLAKWNFKEINTLGIGIGYNYTNKKAFSFNIGLGVPISFHQTLHQNIGLESKQGVVFSQLDRNLGIEKIKEEQFYFPIQIYFNAGFNLKRLFTKRNPFS